MARIHLRPTWVYHWLPKVPGGGPGKSAAEAVVHAGDDKVFPEGVEGGCAGGHMGFDEVVVAGRVAAWDDLVCSG